MANVNQTSTTTPANSSRVGEAVGNLRNRASGANERIGGAVDGAPLAAIAAGVALGAVAGALLPRTDKETELLGPLGSKIGQAAAEAAKAARDAGKQELGMLGENKSPLEMLTEKAVNAVSAAGSAAGNAASASVSGKQDA